MRALLAKFVQFFKSEADSWKGNQLGCDLILGERVSVDYHNINPRKDARIVVGDDSVIRGQLCLEKDRAQIKIGQRVYFGGFISCAGLVVIGDDVLISGGGGIFDHNSHSLSFSKRANDVITWRSDSKDWTHVPIDPVTIESKAWIGFNVIILQGVTIGEGAVVGAGTVVTKNVPAWSVFAGNPGRVLRELTEDER
jgi:acetyltransferase-like isoleucine patch superfamily enzyme